MGMTINRNIQFEKFVQFAKQSMDTGQTKAIARAGGADVNSSLALRSITASTTDKAFALSRSRADKAENDVARDLFRQSVIDMFGSEDKIPKSVLKAMQLKDYGSGKPLTARRIIAVKHAIEQSLNPMQKMTSSVAKAAVTDAAQHTQLSDAQIKTATKLVAKYGKGLSETSVRLLANFTAKVVTLPEITSAKNIEETVKKFAQDMSKWRNCVVGDSRLAAVDQKMASIAQEKLDKKLGKPQDFNPPAGAYRTFFQSESAHAKYVINGATYGTQDQVLDAFTRLFRGDQKGGQAVSCFLCQTQTKGTLLNELTTDMGLPTIRDEFSKSGAGKPLPGMEILVSSDPADKVYKMPKTHAKETTFTLNVTGDGSRATVLVETKGDIVVALNTAKEKAREPIGTFTWQQEFVFDLTGDQPKIVSAHIGQQLEA